MDKLPEDEDHRNRLLRARDIMVRAAKYTMENLNRIYEGKPPLRIVNK